MNDGRNGLQLHKCRQHSIDLLANIAEAVADLTNILVCFHPLGHFVLNDQHHKIKGFYLHRIGFRGQQRQDPFVDFVNLGICKTIPHLRSTVLADKRHIVLHLDIIIAKALHCTDKICLQLLHIFFFKIGAPALFNQRSQNAQPPLIDQFALGCYGPALSIAFSIYSRPGVASAEETKVIVIVKDQKSLLVHTGTEHIVAEARATAHHLQELDLGLDFLKKHQVQHIRHVNTGVHHIHGNRHLGQLIPFTKVINQAQVVYDMAVDQLTEI